MQHRNRYPKRYKHPSPEVFKASSDKAMADLTGAGYGPVLNRGRARDLQSSLITDISTSQSSEVSSLSVRRGPFWNLP